MMEYALTPFVCARCGNCCRGEGFVRVSPEEQRAMAAYLGIGLEEFQRLYTRPPEIAEHAAAGDLWLRDQPGPEQACIFLGPDNSCRVHPVKPQKCKDFPLKWRTPDVMEYCVGLRGERPEPT